MHSRHSCICTIAIVLWGCGSTDGGVRAIPSGGSAGVAGSAGLAGSPTTAGSGSGGSTSGSGGMPHAGSSTGGSVPLAGAGGETGGAQRCLEPEDRSGNWSLCSNRQLHRSAPGSCDSNLPRARVLESTENGADQCHQDSDCTAQPNGFCEPILFPPHDYSNKCTYGCTTDAECGADEVCVCLAITPLSDPASGPMKLSAVIGTCQPTADGCRSDADCPGDNWCTNYKPDCAGSAIAFACQTPADECASDFDCAGDDFCSYENGARICRPVTCHF